MILSQTKRKIFHIISLIVNTFFFFFYSGIAGNNNKISMTMLETVSEKKIPPPLPPKTRRGCPKNGDGGSGGATILSNGHVVKIRIDPMMGEGGVGGVGGGGGQMKRDDREQPRREHAVGRRSSTVKINITCVDPFVFRRHYNDEADDDDEDDDRRSSSGHRSPLDSGTGSDLDTGSRRDESDDGTCSCDSLTSSTADAEPAPVAAAAAAATDDDEDDPSPAVDAVALAPPVAAVVEELPKRSASPLRPQPPPPPPLIVQQRCYGDASADAVSEHRVIDLDNTDQYYSFHMNENVFDEVDASAAAAMAAGPTDDTFAGCKTGASASDTIRSAKGTIRGVKNRVRAGIATFLQPKTNKVRRLFYPVYDKGAKSLPRAIKYR